MLNFNSMLLTPYIKYVSLKTSKIWYISEKYDGWRLHYYNGEFITRQKEVITLPSHFYEEANDLCESIAKTISQPVDQIVLDGELWCGRGKFDIIKSSIKNNNTKLTYQVFDYGLINDNYKIGFYLRYDVISSNLKDIKSRAVQIVKQTLFKENNEKAIEKYYEKILQNNGEGIVLRPYDLMFSISGGRIPNFYKLKPYEIDKFEVIDYYTTEYAANKYQNNIKEEYVSSLVCRINTDTFKVTCKTFKKYLPKIGEFVKVKYTQTTCKGLPKKSQIMF